MADIETREKKRKHEEQRQRGKRNAIYWIDKYTKKLFERTAPQTRKREKHAHTQIIRMNLRKQ